MNRNPTIGDVISFYDDEARFVVEGKIFGDNYEMWARSLEILKGKDGEIWKYDPKGAVTSWTDSSGDNVIDLKDIKFHGQIDNVIDLKDIKFHGQMKMIFVK